MNILITGANGQLGRTLTRALSTGSTTLGPIPAAYHGARVAGVDLPDFDLSKLPVTQALVREARPDIIFHCAAYTRVDDCETHPDDAFCGNVLAARNIAMAACGIGARLCHLSTDYVFSGEQDKPYEEWDLCEPRSVYGHTKRLGEEAVRQHCPASFIVRTAWLYALEGGNFVKTILRLLRENGKATVVSDQRGSPTHAGDLTHHLLKIAAGEEYGLYHCTGGGECSWYEFAREIARLSGLPAEVRPCTTAEFPRPAHRPKHSVLGHRMLRLTVGDQMRPWQKALADYMTHYDAESGDIHP